MKQIAEHAEAFMGKKTEKVVNEAVNLVGSSFVPKDSGEGIIEVLLNNSDFEKSLKFMLDAYKKYMLATTGPSDVGYEDDEDNFDGDGAGFSKNIKNVKDLKKFVINDIMAEVYKRLKRQIKW